MRPGFGDQYKHCSGFCPAWDGWRRLLDRLGLSTVKRLIAAISGLCLLATSAVGFYQSRDSNYNISISGGGGGGFSLVSHTSAVNSATTPGINTTGANLIVIFTTRESSAPTD